MDDRVHYKDCARYYWHNPDDQCNGKRCHPVKECNCHILYDQDCQAEGHEEERRRQRTALFDYMKCREIEAMEGWNEE